MEAMKTISGKLAALEHTDFELSIGEDQYSICFINWSAIVEEELAIEKQYEAVSEAEKETFWAHRQTNRMAIFENFIFEENFELLVNENKLHPIGLLGLSANAHDHGFAEWNNDGFLALDISNCSAENAKVVFIYEDKMEIIAENFDAFLSLIEIVEHVNE